jgi:hypothetical protein
MTASPCSTSHSPFERRKESWCSSTMRRSTLTCPKLVRSRTPVEDHVRAMLPPHRISQTDGSMTMAAGVSGITKVVRQVDNLAAERHTVVPPRQGTV